MLPPDISLKVLAHHGEFRKISQSLRAGAAFSSRIGIFGAHGSTEFTLQPVPSLLGHSRHLYLPLRPV
jgi:hypothetical protein